MAKPKDQVREEWRELVNLTPDELEEWLETEQSQSVGDTGGEGESTGHYSGRRIVAIQRTDEDALSEDDWDWMRKVVGYIKRHLAQGGPDENVEHSAWRWSLMNWGHDPCK